MKRPGFIAEASLGKLARTHHGKYLLGSRSQSQSGLPASVLRSQLEGMEDLKDLEESDLMEEMEAEDEEMEAEDEEMEAEGTEFEQ